MKIFLLPGMDGTGRLYRPLLDIMQPPLEASVIDYPTDQELQYTALVDRVRSQLPADGTPYWILAESYSGPIAIRLGAQEPEGLLGIMVVASFLTSPLPTWLRSFVSPFLFRIPPPRSMLKALLLGSEASDELVNEVRNAIAVVNPRVLAFRARDILSCNVEDDFNACRVSLVFIEAGKDRILRGTGARVKQMRSGVRVITIDAPHLIVQTQPRRVLDQLTNCICIYGDWRNRRVAFCGYCYTSMSNQEIPICPQCGHDHRQIERWIEPRLDRQRKRTRHILRTIAFISCLVLLGIWIYRSL